MAKLRFNDDGEPIIPLPDGELVLPEPTLGQLGTINSWFGEADQKLAAEPDRVARTILVYGPESPYRKAAEDTVQLLAGRGIPDEAPGWVVSPETWAIILTRWRSPLPGSE